ncbi:MAG: hypothetical protein EAX90_08310 [Candidatus Heimdallarchaeota archaeon]|nr:hypothetical protein [Candidatus Heimdallarchaeota archaeon]
MAKILMITHSLTPDKRIDQEAESLTQNGHQVHLICGGKKINFEVPKIYHTVDYIHLTKFQQAFLYFPVKKAAKEYKKIINQLNPDIIHAHDLMAANIVRFTLKKGNKFVYDDHELWELIRKIKTKNIKNPIKKIIRYFLYVSSKRINKKVMKKADLIIVVNNYWIKFYGKKGLSEKKIITIENFPKMNLIEQALNYQEELNEFIINDQRKKIVFSSAGSKASLDAIRKIDIYAEAVQELSNWVMIIFGPEDEKYIKLGVHFIPPKPIVEYLANCSKCDLMLNPLILNERNHYSSINRVFEAANLGIRIITTNLKTLEEKFENKLITVPINIGKEELKQILREIDRYPTGKEISTIAKKFTWENQISILISGYDSLLN